MIVIMVDIIISQSVRTCFWTATLLRTKRIANNNKINNLDSKITSCPSFAHSLDNALNPFCNDFEKPNLNCLISFL